MNSNTLNIAIEVDDNGTPKIRKIGNELETASGKGEKGFKRTGKTLGDFNAKVSVAGKATMLAFAGITGVVTALGVAGGALVLSAARQAKEIENLSRLSNMGTVEFQNYAYATASVGIQAEKLGDISKDVRDKLGDFIATGGGEFADFFEQVAPQIGLTAKELQGLSGPDILIAVKDAMDAVNVSAEEQIFYLESLANDSSLLIPLLEDSGAALKAQAVHASELGFALSTIESEKLLEAAATGKDLTSVFEALKNKAGAELAPAFVMIGNTAVDVATWVIDGWENIDLAFVALLDGIIAGWINIKFGGKETALTLTSIFGVAGDEILEAWAGMLSGMADSLDSISFTVVNPFGNDWTIGFDSATATIREHVENLQGASTASEDYRSASAALLVAKEQELQIHNDTIDAMVDEVYGLNQAVISKDTLVNSTEQLTDALVDEDKKWQMVAKAQHEGMQLGITDMFMGLDAANKRSKGMIAGMEKEATASKKSAADQATAYRHMYDDMDEYSDDHYDLQVKLLDKEARKFKELGAKEDVVNRWRTRKHEELYDKYQLHVGSFVDGMAVAWRQMERDQLTWAEGGKAIFDTFIAESTSALSDNLFSVMKGDFENLGGVWDSLWDTMLRTLADTLAQMAVEYAASKITKFIGSIFFHDGAIEIKEDEFPAILQRGEMVIPAKNAERIRDGLRSLHVPDNHAFDFLSGGGGSHDGMSEGVGMDDGLGAGASPSGGLGLGTLGTSIGENVGAQLGNLAGGFFSGTIGPADVANAAAAAIGGIAIDALGFDTAAGGLGSKVGAGLGAMLGLGPAAAAVGVVGAVGFEAIADAMDTREHEGFLDAMEDGLGFFGAHAAMGSLSDRGFDFEEIEAAGAMGAFGAALEGIGYDMANAVNGIAAGEGGGDGDVGGVEGIGADMGNPGSDMGNIGDDVGGMMARDGGVFSGPDSGYRMTLHGTEAVIPLRDGIVPVEIRGADKEGSAALLAEVKHLAALTRHNNYQISQIVKNTGKSTRVLDKWDYDGQPAVRTQ